eukprot:1735843-Rhodomonas_salina.1
MHLFISYHTHTPCTSQAGVTPDSLRSLNSLTPVQEWTFRMGGWSASTGEGTQRRASEQAQGKSGSAREGGGERESKMEGGRGSGCVCEREKRERDIEREREKPCSEHVPPQPGTNRLSRERCTPRAHGGTEGDRESRDLVLVVAEDEKVPLRLSCTARAVQTAREVTWQRA